MPRCYLRGLGASQRGSIKASFYQVGLVWLKQNQGLFMKNNTSATRNQIIQEIPIKTQQLDKSSGRLKPGFKLCQHVLKRRSPLSVRCHVRTGCWWHQAWGVPWTECYQAQRYQLYTGFSRLKTKNIYLFSVKVSDSLSHRTWQEITRVGHIRDSLEDVKRSGCF